MIIRLLHFAGIYIVLIFIISKCWSTRTECDALDALQEKQQQHLLEVSESIAALRNSDLMLCLR